MRRTTLELIGREDELQAIVHVLDASEQLPAAALLHGEAGIGKTTIWRAGIDAAVERGYRVLSSRPSEAETRFSYAGLGDLLGGVADAVLPELPAIQRRSLETALLLGDPGGRTDERAVAAAFLAVLRLLAAETPLCLAVDDLQWLDEASVAALRFASSRLADARVAALHAVRGNPPTWLRRGVADAPAVQIEIAGLSIGATHELLGSRLGVSFPRPTLVRLWEAADGNPFFILELADALRRRGGALELGEELPVPSSLADLLGERLRALGSGARDVVQVAAALAEPTADLVHAVVPSDDGLAEALEAQVLELDADRIRFAHPLLASAALARVTASQRGSLHARLAELAPTEEERARHLALATTSPSAEIAATLEAAARSAHGRGAPAAAAELAEQALRLTPPPDTQDARRRLLLAADRHHVAGDLNRAVSLLGSALAGAAAGTERGEVRVQLGDVLFHTQPRKAEDLYRQALDEAAGNDALEATAHLRLADSMRWGAGIEAGLSHAALAAEAASRTDDIALRANALCVRADWQFRAGGGVQRAEMEEALALERSLPGWPLVGGTAGAFSHQLLWAVELDAARELLLELLEIRRHEDDAHTEAWTRWSLGLLEWRAGNWDEADRYASDALELRLQLGGVSYADEFPASIIAAHKGRLDEARTRAERSISRAATAEVVIDQSGQSWVLGFVELSLNDGSTALGHLRRSYELRNRFMLEPGQRLELGDLLEALVAVGDLDEADAIALTWQERAVALDRPWALAILARCRGLLLAARGDPTAAFASFDRALVEHARSADPFHHARTLLALGRTQRRAKKRAAARSTLAEAHAGFERLGAPLWAEQARVELARIGGRAPSRGDLTEAESRIAALVTEGRTNRDVETSLTRVYRKLGVRSRAELIRLRAEGG